MRVLLISHTCQSPTEGQPRVRWLAKQPGLELCVLIPNQWRHYGCWRGATIAEDVRSFCRVEPVAFPWVGPAQFYLHWYPRLASLLKSFRPDVIDLWEEPWGLVSAQAVRLRNKLLPATRIISETEQNICKQLPFPFEQFRRYTLKHADFAVARSHEAAEVLRSKGYAGEVEVVPNGVDVELFRPMNRSECRSAIGAMGFQVGYVGRLVEEKGLSDLVESLKWCDPSVQLLFVGAGPAKPALETQAARQGCAGRARFLENRPLEQLPEVMNGLDCLVLPSRTTDRWKEQFGRVLIEAGACGIPVIGSDSGAIPDVVGDAGLVAPERNPRELAAAIEKLRVDADLRTRMGKAGLRQAVEQYSWQRVAARMEEIYRRVSKAEGSESAASEISVPIGAETGA